MSVEAEIRQSVALWLESGGARRIALSVGLRSHARREEMDDIAQEVARSLLRIGLERSVNSTFVYRVARRRAADAFEQRGRDLVPVAKPERAVSDPELVALVHARVARQPAKSRAVFRLRVDEGRTQREVCEILHITRPALRSLEASLVQAL